MYDCSTWAVRAQWGLPTADAADLAWSPDGGCLAVWESALYGHQLAVYTPEVRRAGVEVVGPFVRAIRVSLHICDAC